MKYMKTKTIGNILIGLGVFNSLFIVFRLYYYFFTGNDLTPLSYDNRVGVTFGMCFVSIVLYFVGAILKD